MKKRLLIPALLLSSFVLAAAESYDSFCAAAENSPNMKVRFDNWAKAETVATDQQKTELYKKAYAYALRAKSPEYLAKYGMLYSKCEGISDAERAEARYHALNSMKDPEPTSQDWLEYLALPGKNEEQEFSVKMSLADAYIKEFETRKAMALLESLLTLPNIRAPKKIDVQFRIASIHLMCGRKNEAIAIQNDILNNKALTPARRGNLYMEIAETILQGNGFYHNLTDKDLAEAENYLNQAAEVRVNGQFVFYAQAKIRLVQMYFDQEKYQTAVEEAKKAFASKKVNGFPNWAKLTDLAGQSKLKAGDYEGAIADLEGLRTRGYNIGDTGRYLGEAYYYNKQYTLGIGCFDEAKTLLEKQKDETDRPKWCTWWLGKLRWYTYGGNDKKLESIISKHYASADSAPAQTAKTAPGASASARKPASAGKTKKQIKSLEDIEASQNKDITADGLDLD